jgi:hypothetical protein
MGAAAVDYLLDGATDGYICLQGSEMVLQSYREGLAAPRPIDPERLRLAEGMSL